MVGMEVAAVARLLNILANNLAPLVMKQYSTIVGVEKDLQDLQDLVESINHWLETARYNAMDSGGSFNWLRQLKDVVYDVDNIVDKFHLKAEEHEAHGSDHIVSKLLITKPKSFLFQCKAAHEIKKIKDKFDEVVKQRNQFNEIRNSLPCDHPALHTETTAGAITTLPVVDEALVCGRGQEKHEIIRRLVDNNDQKIIKIVSVIGLGGSGKTTLAKLVFNDGNIVKDHFEVRIWVHVSQEFDVKKLNEKLFEAISCEKSTHHSLQQMAKTILDKLTGKRYLLVLDDVWNEDRMEWEEFMKYVKSGAPGSSILLTTRNEKVAETVESTGAFNLPFLSEGDSWALFSQSFGRSIKGLDSELLDVGIQIVNRCGGLPLAIKVLAGVLRDKRRIEEWKAMRDSNLLAVEDKANKVLACLTLSYFYLPDHLKHCFTMCSIFPKGHKIYKDQLIDLWIAHNMINLTIGVDYLEDIGEKYFNSLVQVSFLHDVDEYDGRLQCKMHDLVHDLAQSILHEEFSTNVPEDATSSTKGYRYFSLIEQPTKPLSKKVFHNARAMYVDKGSGIIFGKALKNAKHLRSITINGDLPTTVLTAIFQIKYLKYLEMSRLQCEALPEAISDIWSLQALHVTYSCLLELPKSIGKLQKLRVLNLSGCSELKCLPDSICNCIMLSSIDLCKCMELTALPNSIGKNEKLKVLRVHYTKIETLPSSIKSLRNLECLDLYSCLELVELPEGICDLEKLQVLNLEYCRKLVELPKGINNLEKLQVLNLKYCAELEGMPIGIRQLSRLQKLGLFVVGEGKKFARISELANASRIGGDLSIRGIARVMEPEDAHRACLKHKTNLQRLSLEWNRYVDVGEVSIELEQAVLDNLEPPPGIKELEIRKYSGREYARWMQNQVDCGVQGFSYFQSLRVMTLCDFPNLKHLYGLVELPCLEELKLFLMPSLQGISGGPFPSLVKLVMTNLESLGKVWIAAERNRTLSDGEVGGSNSNCTPHLQPLRVGSCVTHLDINRCLKLPEGLGSITSLQTLTCFDIGTMPESLGEFRSLQSLTIMLCRSLISLPPIGHITSLQVLHILRCDELNQLPQCLGDLCSLQKLNIEGLPRLACLPESICGLTSLKELNIEDCLSLTSLPEGIKTLSSLEQLTVNKCPEIRSLPEGIKGLTSLKVLIIWDCPGIKSLPEGMKTLSSLEELRVTSCPEIRSLPEGIKGLTALRYLEIHKLPRLACLPESICGLTSLKVLNITDCLSLTSLPEGMKTLSSLEVLMVTENPFLP